MRFLYFIGILLIFPLAHAQETSEDEVKQAIKDFFKGFHAQDTLVLKDAVSPDIHMQTIGTNKEGDVMVRTVAYKDFMSSIAKIPDSVNFDERILSFQISVDGPMANAWTPYEFWINGKFSHCGVNSFQLYKGSDGWKIIYLVDTRRRENCQ